MPAALRSGGVDVAISICPERSGELAYETIRSDRIAALVAATHPLAGKGEVELNAFADDAFVLFPRQLAPRLFDVIVALCRRAGFEPRVRSESFHTGWDTGVLADVGVADRL